MTGIEVGEIFYHMPIRNVHAYQHCYMVSNGVDCKYPKGREKGLLHELNDWTLENG